jgi:hypothetical protein
VGSDAGLVIVPPGPSEIINSSALVPCARRHPELVLGSYSIGMMVMMPRIAPFAALDLYVAWKEARRHRSSAFCYVGWDRQRLEGIVALR